MMASAFEIFQVSLSLGQCKDGLMVVLNVVVLVGPGPLVLRA